MPEIEDFMDYSKSPGDGYTWMSVCSAHFETNPDCNMCMAGHWSNDEERAADHKLYEEDYDAWYKKHNAPDSDARRILKKFFPNLK